MITLSQREADESDLSLEFQDYEINQNNANYEQISSPTFGNGATDIQSLILIAPPKLRNSISSAYSSQVDSREADGGDEKNHIDQGLEDEFKRLMPENYQKPAI